MYGKGATMFAIGAGDRAMSDDGCKDEENLIKVRGSPLVYG